MTKWLQNLTVLKIYSNRSTHKGCKISFAVKISFLSSSLDKQQALWKPNQPKSLPPKSASSIDIKDYLFSLSEEDSDSKGKGKVKVSLILSLVPRKKAKRRETKKRKYLLDVKGRVNQMISYLHNHF